jgi:protein TonB
VSGDSGLLADPRRRGRSDPAAAWIAAILIHAVILAAPAQIPKKQLRRIFDVTFIRLAGFAESPASPASVAGGSKARTAETSTPALRPETKDAPSADAASEALPVPVPVAGEAEAPGQSPAPLAERRPPPAATTPLPVDSALSPVSPQQYVRRTPDMAESVIALPMEPSISREPLPANAMTETARPPAAAEGPAPPAQASDSSRAPTAQASRPPAQPTAPAGAVPAAAQPAAPGQAAPAEAGIAATRSSAFDPAAKLLASLTSLIEAKAPNAYPETARRRGIEGLTRVIASIDAQGQLLDTRVFSSSGSSLLDQAALRLVDSVFPVENPTGKRLDLKLDVRFALTK